MGRRNEKIKKEPVISMMFKGFNTQTKEFEGILHKLATEITSGILFEHLPPSELWSRVEASITRLKELTETLRDSCLLLKPEKTASIEQKSRILSESLTTFRDILFQNTTDPLTNSKLAFEQLKKAVENGSDFLALAKEARDTPSKLIEAALKLRELGEAKGPVITIETPEELQPVITRLLNRIETLRTAFMTVEKALDDAKEELRKLQEESIKFGDPNKEKSHDPKPEPKETKQANLVSKPEAEKGEN